MNYTYYYLPPCWLLLACMSTHSLSFTLLCWSSKFDLCVCGFSFLSGEIQVEPTAQWHQRTEKGGKIKITGKWLFTYCSDRVSVFFLQKWTKYNLRRFGSGLECYCGSDQHQSGKKVIEKNPKTFKMELLSRKKVGSVETSINLIVVMFGIVHTC